MPAKKAAPAADAAERVEKSFPKLKIGSENLNKVSDQLNESAARFNAALKPLGVGITSWFEFDGGRNEDIGYIWSQEIGYAKLSGKWGLAIKRMSHELGDPEPDIETWPFADAPRALRIKAASHIPDLLDQMIVDIGETVEEVANHAQNIDALTAILAKAASSES